VRDRTGLIVSEGVALRLPLGRRRFEGEKRLCAIVSTCYSKEGTGFSCVLIAPLTQKSYA